ncbi:hypothetical protein AB0P17_13515 [Streptomyces sp. NPDC088124]
MRRIDRAVRMIAAPPAAVYGALLDRAAHEAGIASSLANLASYVEAGG